MTRRSLLERILRLSAGFGLAHSAVGFSQESGTLSLRLSKTPPVPLPANFIGLGYEMSSVAQPGLLRVANHRYVDLIRTLGPSGVLRVGGIVANYTRYEPNGTVVAQPKDTGNFSRCPRTIRGVSAQDRLDDHVERQLCTGDDR